MTYYDNGKITATGALFVYERLHFIHVFVFNVAYLSVFFLFFLLCFVCFMTSFFFVTDIVLTAFGCVCTIARDQSL